jgi:hypothetical protein
MAVFQREQLVFHYGSNPTAIHSLSTCFFKATLKLALYPKLLVYAKIIIFMKNAKYWRKLQKCKRTIDP